MSVESCLNEHFPGSMSEDAFVRATVDQLAPLGFSEGAFACVGTCRDELCTPFRVKVRKAFGESFNLSALAGLPTLGRTGFLAAQVHAPIEDGVEHYVYYVMAHIAVGPDGDFGPCLRPGRAEVSVACGALSLYLLDHSRGAVATEFDPDDMEQSILRQRLHSHLGEGGSLTLLDVTRAVHDLIADDLRRMTRLTVDTASTNYAAFTGIQLHTPAGEPDRIWCGEAYAVMGGREQTIYLQPPG